LSAFSCKKFEFIEYDGVSKKTEYLEVLMVKMKKNQMSQIKFKIYNGHNFDNVNSHIDFSD
jgi:hypothetical protein